MVMIRYLGNACVEIISDKGHIIIDPNYIEEPKEGIESIFLTSDHEDHFNQNKIETIVKEYSVNVQQKDFHIFGPNTITKKLSMVPEIVENGSKIKIKDILVNVFENSSLKMKECLAFLINVEDKAILHTSDSVYFSEQLKNIKKPIDYCFVSCEKKFHKQYINFLKEIQPEIVIPYLFQPDKREMAEKLLEHLEYHNIESRIFTSGSEFSF